MKVIEKKTPKDCSLTIHVTADEAEYLRARTRQTGLSLGDIVRAEYLTKTAEAFFSKQQKTKTVNGRQAMASPPA